MLEVPPGRFKASDAVDLRAWSEPCWRRSSRWRRLRPRRAPPSATACWSSRRQRASATTRSRPAWRRSGRMGRRNGFAVTHTEDSAVFRRRLGRYAAVVWLSVTGDVLDGAEQAGLRRYVLRGGGFAGIHAASNAEDGWPWYRRLIGARFRTHPAVQPATIRVVDRRHPSTRRLPRRWARTDEWYDFQTRPGAACAGARDARRGDVHRRRHGRAAPDRVVPQARPRPLVVHGPRAHDGELRRAAVPVAPARRHPLGRAAALSARRGRAARRR